MKEILQKLKLIDYLTTEIEIQKGLFVGKLQSQVDKGDTGFFSDMFDIFSSNKNEYKGHVGLDNFKIKRRRRFFDMNMYLAIAKGSFRQNENVLIIETEINGFANIMIPFYLAGIIVYSLFIGAFFLGDNFNGSEAVALPFILLHASFMFGLPYFMMKRSTKRMKRELELEFYYMTKKSPT